MTSMQNQVLDVVEGKAKELDFRVAVVGGLVRDELLNTKMPSLDIDLCVEGDGLKLAEACFASLQGELKRYPNFRAATLEIGEVAVDFVTARTETYPKSGSLPEVTWDTIEHDLPRRDFTINAIAQLLADYQDETGILIDPTGGQIDLQQKTIRIIHEKSFIDDPTRLFRAVRYAARLGFVLEPGTMQAFKEAVQGEALKTISNKRIFTEYKKILRESSWKECLMMLEDLQLYIPNQKGINYKEIISQLSASSDRYTDFLTYYSQSLGGTQSRAFLDSLSLSREARDKIEKAA